MKLEPKLPVYKIWPFLKDYEKTKDEERGSHDDTAVSGVVNIVVTRR